MASAIRYMTTYFHKNNHHAKFSNIQQDVDWGTVGGWGGEWGGGGASCKNYTMKCSFYGKYSAAHCVNFQPTSVLIILCEEILSQGTFVKPPYSFTIC